MTLNTIHYCHFFKYSSGNRMQRNWAVIFQVLFIFFLVYWNYIGNVLFSKDDPKINSRGFQIEASQIFIIRMLIIY